MAARSGQREGAEAFTAPAQVNQRRYEALRAYFTEGLSYAEAGARLGYTRWAMINLVRDYRAGKLELFAPPRRPCPLPGVAPANDRARGWLIALRRPVQLVNAQRLLMFVDEDDGPPVAFPKSGVDPLHFAVGVLLQRLICRQL